MGIDLSKNSFHVHAVNEAGRPVLQNLMNRAQLRQFLALTAPCVVASAFHWARYATQQCGDRTRIIASQFVKPYVKAERMDRLATYRQITVL
jgi:transposase